MAENSEGEEGRNYRKLLKVIVIGAGICLFPVVVLGSLLAFLFYSILLYITILVSIIGYVGGIWLWEYLASSELLTGEMNSLIKKVGWGALVLFVVLISGTVFLAFTAQPAMLESTVNLINWLLLFMLAYNIGYLISIWRRPLELNGGDNISSDDIKVDWRIVKAVFRIAVPSLATILGATLIIGIIQGQINTMLFAIGIQLLLFLGFCLGYVIWEHLKRTNLISGKFKTQLKWISVLFLIISGGLTFYGFIMVSAEVINVQILRELMLYYGVFLVCLCFYFLGLYISILKSK